MGKASEMAKAIVNVKQSMRRTKGGGQTVVHAHTMAVNHAALLAGIAKELHPGLREAVDKAIARHEETGGRAIHLRHEGGRWRTSNTKPEANGKPQLHVRGGHVHVSMNGQAVYKVPLQATGTAPLPKTTRQAKPEKAAEAKPSAKAVTIAKPSGRRAAPAKADPVKAAPADKPPAKATRPAKAAPAKETPKVQAMHVATRDSMRDAEDAARHMSQQKPGVPFHVGEKTVRRGGLNVPTYFVHEAAHSPHLFQHGAYVDGKHYHHGETPSAKADRDEAYEKARAGMRSSKVDPKAARAIAAAGGSVPAKTPEPIADPADTKATLAPDHQRMADHLDRLGHAWVAGAGGLLTPDGAANRKKALDAAKAIHEATGKDVHVVRTRGSYELRAAAPASTADGHTEATFRSDTPQEGHLKAIANGRDGKKAAIARMLYASLTGKKDPALDPYDRLPTEHQALLRGATKAQIDRVVDHAAKTPDAHGKWQHDHDNIDESFEHAGLKQAAKPGSEGLYGMHIDEVEHHGDIEREEPAIRKAGGRILPQHTRMNTGGQGGYDDPDLGHESAHVMIDVGNQTHREFRRRHREAQAAEYAEEQRRYGR